MEQVRNPLNIVEKPVGATLAVARIEIRGLVAGRDKPVPYDPLFLARPRAGTGVETSMEQVRNPLNIMEKPVGATLVVARIEICGLVAGRDKPVPYGSSSSRIIASANTGAAASIQSGSVSSPVS